MTGLLNEFLTEARDLVEATSQGLLVLEGTPDDPESVNTVFRSIHTLKGASGIFDIAPFTNTVHAAEDLLDAVRDGRVMLTPEIVDRLFEALDQVSIWLENLEVDEALSDGAAETGRALSARLRAFIGGSSEGANGAVDAVEDGAVDGLGCEWLATVPEDVRRDLFTRLSNDGGSLVAITYEPDESAFFCGDDPFFTVRQIPGTVWAEIVPRQSWPEPADFDPYQCNLCFRLLAVSDQAPISDMLRYVESQSTVAPIGAIDLALPNGASDAAVELEAFAASARELIERADWEALSAAVASAQESAPGDSLQASALRWMEAALAVPDPQAELVARLVEVVTLGVAPSPTATWNNARPEGNSSNGKEAGGDGNAGGMSPAVTAARILADVREGLALPIAPEIWDGQLASTSVVLARVFSELRLSDCADALDGVLEAAGTERSYAPIRDLVGRALDLIGADDPQEESEAPGSAPVDALETKPQNGTRSSILKVDQTRVDTLMDLAGELIVAKNGLPFLARRAEDSFGARELAREIKAQYEVINRIADDFQAAVMQVRMVPLDQIFQRFNRLVRDVSRKLDKRVKLEIKGGDAEADKNVAEDLANPLVHLLRNSVDHGIETPEERVRAGKPEEGVIRLSAQSMGDYVLIEVADDGKGIDPEIIKRKAYEKGLLDEQRLDSIGDQEALQYILMPGFSTAQEVSEFSGRGVGMDVVRSMVEGCGGRISIESEVGKGTTIQIHLPLSMAVSRVMIVDVAGHSFGISMDSIVETVRIPTDDIHRVKTREAVVLRDRLIPLCRLAETLDLKPNVEMNGRSDEAVLIVRVDNHELGLVVDRFHAGVDIILKPLEGIMAGYTLYSGTALLGDGSVLLVLNLQELMQCLS